MCATSSAFLKGIAFDYNVLSLEANFAVPNVRADECNALLVVTD